MHAMAVFYYTLNLNFLQTLLQFSLYAISQNLTRQAIWIYCIYRDNSFMIQNKFTTKDKVKVYLFIYIIISWILLFLDCFQEFKTALD